MLFNVFCILYKGFWYDAQKKKMKLEIWNCDINTIWESKLSQRFMSGGQNKVFFDESQVSFCNAAQDLNLGKKWLKLSSWGFTLSASYWTIFKLICINLSLIRLVLFRTWSIPIFTQFACLKVAKFAFFKGSLFKSIQFLRKSDNLSTP